jgi:hypothetical protein
VSYHGNNYQILTVWNTTDFLGGGEYWNHVLLRNYESGGWWDAYDYGYQATDAQQKDTSVGSWGPIVETFQSVYSGTNAMGALNIMTRSADNDNVWGDWTLLSPTDSIVMPPTDGFQLQFPIDPNYDFLVVS